MMSLRRLFVRSCNIGGECDNAVVATFGPKDETCSCSEHLKQALQEFGLPTVVLDWVHVDQDLFDAATIANQVDAAIATSETWSIEESEAGRLPHVLAEVLALQPHEDWPAAVPGIYSPQAGPKPANRLWSQLVPSDPSDQRTYAPVPISKKTHRLPIELLRKVVGLVESERAKAFLADVLWCAATEKGFADVAVAAHTMCALGDESGKHLRAIQSSLINQDPEQHEKDLDGRTDRFRLSHLRRAVTLAQIFNDSATLERLFGHAHLLISRLDSQDDPTDVLDAVSPAFQRVPNWWDETAEAETKRIESLANAPIQAQLDAHYELRIKRAQAINDPPLVAALRARQIRNYWYAVDNSPADGFLKSDWARRAHDLAVAHLPDLVTEARTRYAAIDKSDGTKKSTFEQPIDPLLLQYRQALLKCVDALPNTLDRLLLLASVTDHFRSIYKTSDGFSRTRFSNMFTTISIGALERVSASDEARESHSRSQQISSHLQLEAQITTWPILARILDLFDPAETWPASFPFFDQLSMDRLRKGLGFAKERDFDSAAHLFAPLVERVVKRVARERNVRPIVPASSDGGKGNPGALGNVLLSLNSPNQLGAVAVTGFLFLLTADVPVQTLADGTKLPAIDGLNLRNDISHGEGEEPFGFMATLILLLCLANLGGTHEHGDHLAMRAIDIQNLMKSLALDTSEFWKSGCD